MDGSLSDIATDRRELGFLAFLRLTGTLYFKKHLASFMSVLNVERPDQLYNLTDPSLTPSERHKAFIKRFIQ